MAKTIKNIGQHDLKMICLQYKIPCCYCGKEMKWDNITIDHIKPKSKLGSSKIDNLICCCQECNCIKSSVSVDRYVGFDNITHFINHVYDMDKIICNYAHKLLDNVDKNSLLYLTYSLLKNKR